MFGVAQFSNVCVLFNRKIWRFGCCYPGKKRKKKDNIVETNINDFSNTKECKKNAIDL